MVKIFVLEMLGTRRNSPRKMIFNLIPREWMEGEEWWTIVKGQARSADVCSLLNYQ